MEADGERLLHISVALYFDAGMRNPFYDRATICKSKGL